LGTDEGRAALAVVQQYTRAWRLLLEYDEGRLPEKPGHPVTPAAGLSPEDATTIIARLRETLAARGEASDLFGAERAKTGFHRLLVDSVTVEYRADGSIRGAQVRLLDFGNPDNNEWLAVNQFTEFDSRKRGNKRLDRAGGLRLFAGQG
jgi:hypothetical protein